MNQSNRLRVRRWVYMRGHDRIRCVLALAVDARVYEFSISHLSTRSSTSIDRFEDIVEAIGCHSTYEGALIAEGWSLETYQTSLLQVSVQ
jgi:hypothetical protein